MGDHNRLIEQAGVGFFACVVSKLGYLCRLTGQHDKGVDAEIELTQPINALSNKIGIQIKSRSEFRNTQKNEISITVTEQNLHYWKSYGRPVILVTYSVHEENLYWVRVDNASSRTIKINLDKKLDSSTQQEFPKIISLYYAEVARNTEVKNVSFILSEIGSTINEVIDPIEKKLVAADKFMSVGKFYEAAQIYEILALVYEDVSSIWSNWVYCLMFSGEVDKAFSIAEQLAVKLPENSEAQCLIGVCLGMLNKDREAETHLLKSIKLAPRSAYAYTSLGLLYHWQDRNKESIDILAKALDYAPNNEFILVKLAMIAFILKDWNTSLNYYDKCIDVNPNFYAVLSTEVSFIKNCGG
ncbi:DUF4365 domain-containing protein [Aliterella atlantica]|uniref:DUF4365 domain-containing protein n=1 Tax=Aliterella atlantica CENA595 TaxID=1618023 RepID=A0A0D8ZSA2_9CYAN|nr:DUF4365 domain-containing protein [Aliterella atlantica]KJH71202.1 hypothetical protein UH38_14455 [Aliterella atlantica CENA595]